MPLSCAVHAEPASADSADVRRQDNEQGGTDAAHPAAQPGYLATLRAQAQALIAAGRPEEAFQLVAAHEAAGVGDPDYDYLLGTTALAAGRHAAAVHALERAVLVQPAFAGAWLDLAIAHYRLNELDTADRMLAHVEQNFDPPAALRADIAAVRRNIDSARRWRGWQADIGGFIGHTSNANYGLSVSALRLTLDGVPATLLLDPGYRPRADSFGELRASASRRFELSGGEQADASFALRHRAHASQSAQDQWDASATGSWRRPVAWPGREGAALFAAASVRELRFDDRGVSQLQASGGLRVPVDQCILSARADLDHRRFSGASAYDAVIPWLGAGAECGRTGLQWGGQVRLGRDLALNDRPGGDSLRAEALAFGRWQVQPNLQLGALLVAAHTRDQDAYSPILAGGERRWVNRVAGKLEAIWVPGPNPRSPWAVVIEIESIRDRSNIGLSTLDVTQLLLGLNYRL